MYMYTKFLPMELTEHILVNLLYVYYENCYLHLVINLIHNFYELLGQIVGERKRNGLGAKTQAASYPGPGQSDKHPVNDEEHRVKTSPRHNRDPNALCDAHSSFREGVSRDLHNNAAPPPQLSALCSRNGNFLRGEREQVPTCFREQTNFPLGMGTFGAPLAGVGVEHELELESESENERDREGDRDLEGYREGYRDRGREREPEPERKRIPKLMDLDFGSKHYRPMRHVRA